ncbi:MAG: DUF1570 domain-containing protein [Thermoguttaceae bacterium]
MLCRHAFSADRLAMDAMVAVTFQGRNVEGAAVEWNSEEVHLLGRDGRLWQFDPREAVHFRKTADHFRPYSPSEFRAALLRELGGEYEVTGTGHYLIAHPRGQQDRWAERFENLDRAFVHYFSVRGLQPATPLFPMVGIVCKDRAEFDRRMTASRATHSPAGERVFYRSGVEGYYRIDTNRLHLYDMGGNPNSATWHTNAAVLIHEATHQTAFNTGVHSRFSPPPRWLAEGLAMLFEAPGVCDPRNHPEPADRVNRGRLDAFRKMLARHRPEMLAAIVADDELFRVAPDAAYAEAWAITFFLAENEPAKYVRYLKRTASHPAFAPYTKAERMADFTAIFGADWRMLEARLLRCLNGLP